jgi:NAD-dependent SIR2 family protein deacetylase
MRIIPMQLDVPPCLHCSGVLMPNVVFFGGSVPKEKVDWSRSMIEEADRVLVLGSSLQTWSSYRLARKASQEGKPVGVVNVGETRADPLASMQVHARVGEVLGRLVHSGSPLATPRGLNSSTGAQSDSAVAVA